MLSLMSNRQTAAARRQVILYTRPGCHLCEEAKQEMTAAGCTDEYTLQEINIESDAVLLRRYRYDIPVITIDGAEAFRHRLTAEAFRERIRAEASPPFPSQD
jgi:glutaredoxin